MTRERIAGLEDKDLLLRPDEIPNELVSDLFPMDNTDKVAELFNRWGKNKVDICKKQNEKTIRKMLKLGYRLPPKLELIGVQRRAMICFSVFGKEGALIVSKLKKVSKLLTQAQLDADRKAQPLTLTDTEKDHIKTALKKGLRRVLVHLLPVHCGKAGT